MVNSYLYVEDDMHSREAMKIIIERAMRQNLTIYEDSNDIAQKLETLSPIPQMILLDIHMTPLNGFEVLKLIRQMTQFDNIPVVALTASVMNEEVKELREAGFSGVIAKPFSLTTMPSLINRIHQGETIWTVAQK